MHVTWTIVIDIKFHRQKELNYTTSVQLQSPNTTP